MVLSAQVVHQAGCLVAAEDLPPFDLYHEYRVRLERLVGLADLWDLGLSNRVGRVHPVDLVCLDP